MDVKGVHIRNWLEVNLEKLTLSKSSNPIKVRINLQPAEILRDYSNWREQ